MTLYRRMCMHWHVRVILHLKIAYDYLAFLVVYLESYLCMCLSLNQK